MKPTRLLRTSFAATLLGLGFAVPSAHAAGLGDLFNSVTSAIKPKETERKQGQTATLGIRGMDDDGTKSTSGPAASGDNAMMEGWAASPAEAKKAAAKRSLVARAVTVKAAPAGGQQ